MARLERIQKAEQLKIQMDTDLNKKRLLKVKKC